MRRLLRYLLLAAFGIHSACGGPSATSPTPGPSLSRVVSVVGSLDFGTVAVGSSASTSLTITNSGNAAVTISSIALPTGFSASWTSGTMPPGTSVVTTIRFAPTLAQRYDGQLALIGDQTSGARTVPVSGAGVALPLVQIVGIITDASSGGVLPGILVEITSGPDSGKSVTTSSSGAYSLVVSAGAFTIQVSAASYVTQTREVTISASTIISFVLQRAAGSSGPASARTSLSFVSDPNDWVGQGKSRALGLADGTWLATLDSTFGDHIDVTINRDGGYLAWLLSLSAPVGQRFSVGRTYEVDTANTPYPDLQFIGDARACNHVKGHFTINALVVSNQFVGLNRAIDYLSATFEQHCDGSPSGSYGQVTIAANPWR